MPRDNIVTGGGGGRVEHIGRATLYLGDCADVMPIVGPFGSILSDVPYGMNYRSGHNSSRVGAGAAMIRKDGNFAPIRGDDKPFDPAPLLAFKVPTILWGADHYCDRLAPNMRWFIWDKLAGKTPVPSGSDVEMAWANFSGPSRIFTHLWRGIMRAGEENVVNGGKLHPNQKPVALMLWCLQHLPDAGPVLDPYMGSGSTGIACLRVGREFIGIEDDPAHFEVACHRFREEHLRIEDAQRRANLFEAA